MMLSEASFASSIFFWTFSIVDGIYFVHVCCDIALDKGLKRKPGVARG